MSLKHHCYIPALGAAALLLVAAPVLAADDAKQDFRVLQALSRAIARVADKVRPGVVSIYTTKTVKFRRPPGMDRFPLPPGWPFGQRPEREEPEERKFRRRGLGSGFIIDAGKGHIVTNHHVIDGAEDIKVRLTDTREFDAKVVGTDKKTDIAVLKIKADDLTELALGNSDKLAVGEFVIAVGSPFGLRETVTSGIVSAKGRAGLAIEDYEDFIQTDAAINMGNSGGPLVNIEGKVVGVNTAILSRTGGSVGVGFAIPINMARHIIDQLVRTGKVVRGWLGVMIQDLDAEMAKQFGLDEVEGALVSQVIEGTPAAKAELKAGDVIVEYDGKPVRNVAKLRGRVAATAPGSKVKMVVVRNGKRKTLSVKIGKLTDAAVAAARGEETAEALGLSVQNLTEELAETLGIEVKEGVVVTAVEPAGPAAEKNIQRGDVITQVDRRPVKNVAEFEAALKRADLKKGVLLLVANRRGSRFVVLKKNED
jgi:serine protease Do